MKFKSIDTPQARNMAFNIGMIEIINYWKSACPPKIVVKCGYLDAEQIKFWKKIYFYGLGELFYTNNIKTTMEEFVSIETQQKVNENAYEIIKDDSEGYIVPIGGGKDSVVTLETLQISSTSDYALIIDTHHFLQCFHLFHILLRTCFQRSILHYQMRIAQTNQT